MASLFDVQILSQVGIQKAIAIRAAFDELYHRLDHLAGNARDDREFTTVCLKLEEACFFAMKMMSLQPRNKVGVQDLLVKKGRTDYWQRFFRWFIP